MEIQILMEELLELNKKVESILCKSGYVETGDLGMVEYDNENLDEIFVYGKLWELLNHLGYCNKVLNYLQKPISQEGILRASGDKKYMIGGTELDKGDVFEILERDDSRNTYYWRIVDLDSRSDFEGKKARIRRK